MPFVFQIALIIFFLAFTWLSCKDTRHGIYAVIFLLPAYLIRFALLGIPTTALEIMAYILFAVWLMKNKNNLSIRGCLGKFFLHEKILSYGITLLLLGVILSTLYSEDACTSLGVLKGWFVDPLLLFAVLISEIKTQKLTWNIIISYIFSALTVALIALAYAAHNFFTFDMRLRAFYESPNYLAMYLAPALLFAVYLFTSNASSFKNNKKNNASAEVAFNGLIENAFVRSFIIISLALVVFLTKSYGAIFAAAVALILLTLKGYKKNEPIISLAHRRILFALIFFIFLGLSSLSFQKYEQIMDSNGRSSLHSRFMIWDSSFLMLEGSPFFGIGPGTFQKVYLDNQKYFPVPYLEWAVSEPHNTYLAFYLESGLVGFVGFLLIIFWLLKKSWRSDLVFVFLVYFLIHGMVDTLYWKNDLSFIFWIVVAVGYASAKKSLEIKSEP